MDDTSDVERNLLSVSQLCTQIQQGVDLPLPGAQCHVGQEKGRAENGLSSYSIQEEETLTLAGQFQ